MKLTDIARKVIENWFTGSAESLQPNKHQPSKVRVAAKRAAFAASANIVG